MAATSMAAKKPTTLQISHLFGRQRVSDPATIGGLLFAFILIGGAIFMGGQGASFINLPSFLIVILGTAAVTSVSFSPAEVISLPKILNITITRRIYRPKNLALDMLKISEKARAHGTISLQADMARIKHEPFLYRALLVGTDGIKADDIEHLLRAELEALSSRHSKGVSLLRRAAEVAPSMGLIGTLVGLVQMMSTLDDPSSIGPAMAIALLTTFYGAVLGAMALAPLAAKLERNAEEEALIKTLYLIACVSIARQQNPRQLEMMLNTILPPAEQINYFG